MNYKLPIKIIIGIFNYSYIANVVKWYNTSLYTYLPKFLILDAIHILWFLFLVILDLINNNTIYYDSKQRQQNREHVRILYSVFWSLLIIPYDGCYQLLVYHCTWKKITALTVISNDNRILYYKLIGRRVMNISIYITII